jgi:hypothetical protein
MSESNESILAWHFLRLPDHDGNYCTQHSNEIVRVGETLRYDGQLALCVRGLHASVRLIDALNYTPGPIVCRVRMSGTIIHGEDKIVASQRTVIAMADASRHIHEFSCDCAKRALMRERKAKREPDARLWNAIAVKRAWLAGRMSDAQLASAESAAWLAARAAARAAAWSADAAAWSAEREWQNQTLTDRVTALLGVSE